MEQARKAYLTGPQIQARYGVTKMTIHRWLVDARLGFPRPLKINQRNYWLESEVDEWDAARERKGAA